MKYLLILLFIGCMVNQEEVKEEPIPILIKPIEKEEKCKIETDVPCLLTPDGETICQFMEATACHMLIIGEPSYSCVYYKFQDCN